MWKRILSTLLALCVVLALQPGMATAEWAGTPADTAEQRKLQSTGEPVTYASTQASKTLTLGSTINDSIETKGDKNTYEFTLSVSGCVTLDVTSYMQYYTLELYDGGGSRIWYSDSNYWDSATGMRSDTHKVDLEAGTYQLRVGSSSSVGSSISYTGNYTIKTSFAASGANETEPNNSIATANVISMGDIIRGQIPKAAKQDFDYYQFTLSTPGRTTLDITSYMQYYTLELYDGDGSRIWYSDGNYWNSGTGMRSDTHKIDLGAGTYWLRVGSSSSVGSSISYTGNYTIKISSAAFETNETEPNNSIAMANIISMGDTIRGQIPKGSSQDLDHYQFTLSETGQITLDITSYMQYYTLELYNGDGSRIWYSDDNYWTSATGMRSDIHKVDLGAGTYWLRVGSSSSVGSSISYTGNYIIKTSFTASWANETEPNDSIGTADMIPAGNVIRGQISKTAGRDYDYYQFTLSERGQVALDVTSYMQYYTLELYNGDGSRIWYSDGNYWNSATGMRSDIHKIDLGAGTYWLRVGSSSSVGSSISYTGNYTIKVDGIDYAVYSDRGYQVNSISIRDSSGTALTEIPTGSFLASVSITNVASFEDAMVLLAAYSETGAYKGLMYVKVSGLQPNAVFEVTLPVDNSSGDIGRLKAFVVSSFADLRPLSSAASFPA